MPYHYFTLEQRANLESVIRSQMPDYGICVRCGAEIPYVRLVESPAVEYCKACAA